MVIRMKTLSTCLFSLCLAAFAVGCSGEEPANPTIDPAASPGDAGVEPYVPPGTEGHAANPPGDGQ